MSSSKEIRRKIGSVKKTQKITHAMELVAASKMRKAQDRMTVSRPYAHKMYEVIGHLANSHPEYHHPYFNVRPVKRVGMIIVSSDRGLCGSLNTNLFKATLLRMREWEKAGIDIDTCLIGNKAANFYKRIKTNVLGRASHIGDFPEIADIIGIVKVMLDKFDAGEIDELYVCYNQFINTMQQKPYIQPLLPLVPAEDIQASNHHWDYIYEPDAKILIDKLLKRYIESQVYQAVVENIASEQASRMISMKSATDNAGTMIDRLHLAYNKARQAAITRELAEIVSGADAV